MTLGLERISRLLDELDHPERGLHGALVGGTNGKGSVVALVVAVLREAGLRVGTMPKPHLVSYRERIAVDGVPISRERFAAVVREVLPAVDRVAAEVGPPTEFEVLTAAALLELSRSALDLAVVEVGLGGRLDATNAWNPGVAAVTNVSHDHERYLGSTLVRIGTEKAAIIKVGDLAVTGATGRGLAPILERARAVGATLRRAGRDQPYRATLRAMDRDGIVVDLVTPTGTYPAVGVGLLGEHQAVNTAVAVAVVDAIVEDGARRGVHLAIDEAALRRGLRAARWAGRLELLDGRAAGVGTVLLDGAHNPAGAAALAHALPALGAAGAPMVFGAMRDKRIRRVLRPLAAAGLRPVFTAVDDPHARRPEELLHAWRAIGGTGGAAVPGISAALRRAADPGPSGRADRRGGLALPCRGGARPPHRRDGGVTVALRFGEKTWLMGILNVTPDSFSGDGLAPPDRPAAAVVEAALAQAAVFVEAGAQILDVGAESTRPRSAYGDRPTVDPETERDMAVPVVAALADAFGGRTLVSIDTSRGSVAAAALAAGATIVNDVWGGRRDPGTARAAAAAGAYLVVMHNQEGGEYPGGVLETVVRWLRDAVAGAVALGVPRNRLIVDPGIGFAKTLAQNLELLHRLAEIKEALELPLLVGTSRKRFIGELLGGAAPDDREEGTAATVALAIAAGADIVRVHDVAHVARTIRVSDAIVRFSTE